LVTLHHPNFAAAQWQVYLIYVMINVLATIIICYLPKLLPKIEQTFFLSSLFAFVTGFVTLLASSHDKQPGRTVFVNYNNQSGWSDGTSFLIGVGSCMYAFLATDAATHISEVWLLFITLQSADRTRKYQIPGATFLES
jgi:choline transport protein